jgi:hypothetical protein
MLTYETYESNLRLGWVDLCSIAACRLLTGTITNCIICPEYPHASFYKFRYDKFQKAIRCRAETET